MIFLQKNLITNKLIIYEVNSMEQNNSKTRESAFVKIKNMPEEERPIEKLMQKGAETLSDAELLAILIHSGTREKSALGLSNDILSKYKSFRGVAGLDIEELTKIKGIKIARAVRIGAAFEIARRIVNEVMKDE